MFKAKNKSYRTILSQVLYINKAIFLCMMFLYGIFSSSSQSAFLSMDSLLQKTTQLGRPNTIGESGESDQRDIFQRVLGETNNAGGTSIKQALQGISSQINKNATNSCTISDSDIQTILGKSPLLLGDFYHYHNIPSSTIIVTKSTTSTGDLRNSCTKLLRCYGQIDDNSEINDIRGLENCQTIVQNIYSIHSNIYKTNNNISSLNKNDNIYMDGIKENGLFDLMIDIENTKKILFSKDDGPTLPQMIYYSLPTINTSANTINNNQNSIPGGISGIGGTNNTSGLGSNIPANSPTNTLPATTLQNNTISSNINNFISEIQNSNTNSVGSSSTPSTNESNSTIQAAICLPEDNPASQNTDTETGDENTAAYQENIINNLTIIQDQLLNYTSGYLFSTPTANSLVGGSNGYNSNIIQTNGALPSTTQQCANSCSDTTGTEKLICEGKCCIQSCENVTNPADKAICLSQCLCGETSIANDVLRIKICRVPAEPARVLAGKKISSIQEAVDEINEIFNKLKQNGLLIKRSKTKEMLDSSYSKVKFNEILAFDIFVAIKPIYDKLQFSQAKQDAKDQNKNSELIKGYGEKPLQGADRNKYVTLSEKTGVSQIQECSAKGQAYDRATNKCISQNGQQVNLALETLSKGYTKSLINDTFYVFFKEHYQLREEINEKIAELNTITTALRTKAENAE